MSCCLSLLLLFATASDDEESTSASSGSPEEDEFEESECLLAKTYWLYAPVCEPAMPALDMTDGFWDAVVGCDMMLLALHPEQMDEADVQDVYEFTLSLRNMEGTNSVLTTSFAFYVAHRLMERGIVSTDVLDLCRKIFVTHAKQQVELIMNENTGDMRKILAHGINQLVVPFIKDMDHMLKWPLEANHHFSVALCMAEVQRSLSEVLFAVLHADLVEEEDMGNFIADTGNKGLYTEKYCNEALQLANDTTDAGSLENVLARCSLARNALKLKNSLDGDQLEGILGTLNEVTEDQVQAYAAGANPEVSEEVQEAFSELQQLKQELSQ